MRSDVAGEHRHDEAARRPGRAAAAAVGRRSCRRPGTASSSASTVVVSRYDERVRQRLVERRGREDACPVVEDERRLQPERLDLPERDDDQEDQRRSEEHAPATAAPARRAPSAARAGAALKRAGASQGRAARRRHLVDAQCRLGPASAVARSTHKLLNWLQVSFQSSIDCFAWAAGATGSSWPCTRPSRSGPVSVMRRISASLRLGLVEQLPGRRWTGCSCGCRPWSPSPPARAATASTG